MHVRLHPTIEAKLVSLAQDTGRPPEHFIQDALIEYLADLEDLAIALQRLRDYDEGHETAIPLDRLDEHVRALRQ